MILAGKLLLSDISYYFPIIINGIVEGNCRFPRDVHSLKFLGWAAISLRSSKHVQLIPTISHSYPMKIELYLCSSTCETTSVIIYETPSIINSL